MVPETELGSNCTSPCSPSSPCSPEPKMRKLGAGDKGKGAAATARAACRSQAPPARPQACARPAIAPRRAGALATMGGKGAGKENAGPSAPTTSRLPALGARRPLAPMASGSMSSKLKAPFKVCGGVHCMGAMHAAHGVRTHGSSSGGSLAGTHGQWDTAPPPPPSPQVPLPNYQPSERSKR